MSEEAIAPFRPESYSHGHYLNHVLEEIDAASVAAALFGLLEASEFAHGCAARLVRRRSGSDEFSCLSIEMILQLCAEL